MVVPVRRARGDSAFARRTSASASKVSKTASVREGSAAQGADINPMQQLQLWSLKWQHEQHRMLTKQLSEQQQQLFEQQSQQQAAA